jgi:hypothetical protein
MTVVIPSQSPMQSTQVPDPDSRTIDEAAKQKAMGARTPKQGKSAFIFDFHSAKLHNPDSESEPRHDHFL